jgi:hypothetical protein
MKLSRPALIFIIVCIGLGFLLGMFSAFLVAHGQQAIPAAERLMMSVCAAGVLAAVSTFLGGNRAQAQASSEDDHLAKQFTPVAERAIVYVFRDAFYGKFLGLDVALDGTPLGQTRGKTYFRLDLMPGEHVLLSHNPQNGSATEHRFNVAACSISFLEHRVRLGGGALKHDFAVLEAAAGAGRVRRCRMLALPQVQAAAVWPKLFCAL